MQVKVKPRQPFSRARALLEAKAEKIYRAKRMAISKGNPDFNIKYNQETIEASRGDFTKLTKRISEEFDKRQEQNEKRRLKLGTTQ